MSPHTLSPYTPSPHHTTTDHHTILPRTSHSDTTHHTTVRSLEADNSVWPVSHEETTSVYHRCRRLVASCERVLNQGGFHQSTDLDIIGRKDIRSWPIHLTACVLLMAEESVGVVSPGSIVFVLKKMLTETGACLAKALLKRMEGEKDFSCVRKSEDRAGSWGQRSKASSTYLSQTEGRREMEGRSSDSKNSMNRFARTGENPW